MSKAPSEKIERLPKWAQDHIHAVEMERDSARKMLREVRGEVDGSALAYRDARDPEKRWPVAWDQYDEIRFYPNGIEDDRTSVGFRVREPGVVEVMASGTLFVEPRSSNMVYLRAEQGF